MVTLFSLTLLTFSVPAKVINRAGITIITDGGVCLPDTLPLHAPVVCAGILIITFRVALAGTRLTDRLTPIPGRTEFGSLRTDTSFEGITGKPCEAERISLNMDAAIFLITARIFCAVNGIGTIPATAAHALTFPALIADRAEGPIIAGIRIKRVFAFFVIAPVVRARLPVGAIRLTCAITGSVRFLATPCLFA